MTGPTGNNQAMDAFLWPAILGGVLLAAVGLLRRRPLGRRPLPRRGVAAVLAVALAVGLGYWGSILLGYRWRLVQPPTPPPTTVLMPVAGKPAEPLAVGTALPPLRAAGWLNGPPPAPGDAGARVLVVDVWAHW
jgi:hypothetical protein